MPPTVGGDVDSCGDFSRFEFQVQSRFTTDENSDVICDRTFKAGLLNANCVRAGLQIFDSENAILVCVPVLSPV